MPSSSLSRPLFPPDRALVPPWEPALSQLRTLSRPDLDRLVQAWLTELGLHGSRVLDRRPGVATYRAFLGCHPLCVPVQVRLYRRRNRLQVHHVEAFVGHLARQNAAIGLLVSTSGCSNDARLAAQSYETPQLRLLSGEQWAAELAFLRVGLRQQNLRQWLVDLCSLVRARGRHGAPHRTGSQHE
ncbi:MAG TPA: restriction endonuclease [Armatimonadota bacterium]|nr:restriction endonuclease [Armatimonadota bacterium]